MEPEQKPNGALIGLSIIVIILIIGGIYLWKNSARENNIVPDSSDTTGSLDSAADLDANVNSIDLDNLDSEI